jgi:hypothetical protein
MYKLLTIWIFCMGPVAGQFVDGISLNFTKTDYQFLKLDTIKGNIFYNKKKTILEVLYPIHQIFFYEGTDLNIYYPDEARVIKIYTSTQSFLPFFQLFVGIIKDEFSPARMGCEIGEQLFKDDTLVVNWIPTEKVKDIVGKVVVKLVDNNVVYIENYHVTGTMANKIYYSDFKEFQSTPIPMKIVSMNYGEPVFREEVQFSNIRTGPGIDKEIDTFTIPNGTEIKEIYW